MKQYIKLSLNRLSSFFLALSLKVDLIGSRCYEPVSLNGRLLCWPKRDWKERLEAIHSIVDQHSVNSVIDIGCAEGYFLRSLAKSNVSFCLGIDNNKSRLGKAIVTSCYDSDINLAFMNKKITLDNISEIPNADLIIFLSVAHHIIKSNGYEYAVSFVSSLRKKCNSGLIFEMGTPDESSFIGRMKPIETTQSDYVESFLHDCGFTSCTILCESVSIKRDSHRLLYFCK